MLPRSDADADARLALPAARARAKTVTEPAPSQCRGHSSQPPKPIRAHQVPEDDTGTRGGRTPNHISAGAVGPDANEDAWKTPPATKTPTQRRRQLPRARAPTTGIAEPARHPSARAARQQTPTPNAQAAERRAEPDAYGDEAAQQKGAVYQCRDAQARRPSQRAPPQILAHSQTPTTKVPAEQERIAWGMTDTQARQASNVHVHHGVIGSTDTHADTPPLESAFPITRARPPTARLEVQARDAKTRAQTPAAIPQKRRQSHRVVQSNGQAHPSEAPLGHPLGAPLPPPNSLATKTQEPGTAGGEMKAERKDQGRIIVIPAANSCRRRECALPAAHCPRLAQSARGRVGQAKAHERGFGRNSKYNVTHNTHLKSLRAREKTRERRWRRLPGGVVVGIAVGATVQASGGGGGGAVAERGGGGGDWLRIGKRKEEGEEDEEKGRERKERRAGDA
ncbi:hypothetical protein C8R44DRAFT_749101 [Mycena epipterygia]|nr:hypothetical protein C8R44DRAFT_749101 [Mycena epipterygia]